MEKAIISVPTISNKEDILNGSYASGLILKAYKQATFIPENATNGEIIKAMFPNYKFSVDFGWVNVNNNGRICSFCPAEFWNAPYKKQ